MIVNKEITEIFYADDQKADRMLFEIALKVVYLPFRLLTATDGREALAILNEDEHYLPNFIFLDLKMPFIDGHECLHEIRKNERFNHTPVVIFSSSCEERDVSRAYANNANLYVQKPFHIDEQIVILKKIFSFNWEEYFPHPSPEKFVFKIHQ